MCRMQPATASTPHCRQHRTQTPPWRDRHDCWCTTSLRWRRTILRRCKKPASPSAQVTFCLSARSIQAADPSLADHAMQNGDPCLHSTFNCMHIPTMSACAGTGCPQHCGLTLLGSLRCVVRAVRAPGARPPSAARRAACQPAWCRPALHCSGMGAPAEALFCEPHSKVEPCLSSEPVSHAEMTTHHVRK